MDGIKKLAAKLAEHEPELKQAKSSHTLSLRSHDFITLHAYCRRKDLVIGDIVSDLIESLLLELIQSGEIQAADSKRAEELKAANPKNFKMK